MLPRVLEPEVMDTAEEASDYDAMDHAEVNGRFCADLLAAGPLGRRVLDVGTGTALIPIELCRRRSDLDVVAIDLSESMLAVGRRNVTAARLSRRIRLEKIDAKATAWPDGAYDVTISNSIVHHIPTPAGVLAEMWRLTARGGLIFVRDLVRPRSVAEVDHLVQTYSGAPPDEPEARARFDRQSASLRASLCAALTIDEVVSCLAALGVPRSDVALTSDRHWTLSHRKP